LSGRLVCCEASVRGVSHGGGDGGFPNNARGGEGENAGVWRRFGGPMFVLVMFVAHMERLVVHGLC
jgi:hypothetical protein